MKTVLCLAGTMMTLFVAVARSQSASPAAVAKRKELEAIERQLEQKKQEIEQYRRQTDVLRRDLSHLAGEQSSWLGRIRGLEKKISQAEDKKAELKARIGALELAEDRWQGILADEMNGYLRQNLLEFDYYGNGDLWEEPFRRAAILEKVRYVKTLNGFKVDVQKAAVEANEHKTQLQTKTAEAVAERRQREDLYHQKEVAYIESREKFEKTLKDVRELQDSATALNQLVKALEKKSRGKNKMPPFTMVAQEPHSLPWPVEGKLVSSFGRQYVPELHTWVIHQGIRVATGADAQIHPVQAGKVIFAGPFRSYGKVIIVDHGRAFYTIYGGLGHMLKVPGDHVVTSDILGTTETSGSGGMLYFEIRQSVDAVNPIVWLRRR